MGSNIYVVEIMMLEQATNDKEIDNDLSELIGLIEDKGYLLQHKEGIAEAFESITIKEEE